MSEATGGKGLEVGYPEVDAEHQVQVGLVNAVERAIRDGRDASDIEAILDRLVDYTKAHFLSEQLLMRLHAYPDYQAHVQEHEHLIDEVNELRRGHGAGGPRFTLEAVEPLRRWLLGHLRGHDLALGRYLSDVTKQEGSPG